MPKPRARGISLQIASVAVAAIATCGPVLGENIDPANAFAWSENLGWINAQPSGPGGPGAQVTDSGLSGYLWSENAGWISLSGSGFGVANDGCGVLSGYAWSENTGWINFAPTGCGGDTTCGVKISPATGVFSGRAWSENAGWITFASASPIAYHVGTAWRRLAPAAASSISASKSGSDVVLSWAAVSGASSYDVVRGGLLALRSSGGDFTIATQACAVDNTALTTFSASAAPSPGDGSWFLVRASNCGGAGTYDSGALKQIGSRDAEINASGNSCP